MVLRRENKFTSDLSKAQIDLLSGMAKSSLWFSLAWQDIKQRYRRSVLGPFWITASTGVMVAGMGPLYGSLFGQDVAGYLQHLAVSLFIWTFISSSLNEAGLVFIQSEGYIKQIRLPYTGYVFRALARNFLILAHNALVVVVVLLFLPPTEWGNIWLVPIGVFLVFANLFWLSLLLSVISARFRDVPQLVTNIVQVSFFLSPILWKAEMLDPKNRLIADLNPIYSLMEVIRAPILGEPIQIINWIVTTGMLVFGSLATFLFFARFRSRISYWL